MWRHSCNSWLDLIQRTETCVLQVKPGKSLHTLHLTVFWTLCHTSQPELALWIMTDAQLQPPPQQTEIQLLQLKCLQQCEQSETQWGYKRNSQVNPSQWWTYNCEVWEGCKFTILFAHKIDYWYRNKNQEVRYCWKVSGMCMVRKGLGWVELISAIDRYWQDIWNSL